MLLFFRVFTLLWCCVVVHLGADAQISKQIIGRWEYDNVRKINSSELVTGGALKSLVGESSFYEIQEGSAYTSNVNNVFSRGSWKLAGNILTLTSSAGKVRTFEVVTVTKGALVLLIKGEAYHTFIRNKQVLTAANIYSEKEAPLVKPEALMRRWILIELHDSLESKNVNEGMTSFVKGGWYDFRPNGAYVKKMIFKEKTGKWKLSDANRTLIMVDDDGQGAVWHIRFVSATRLELNKPNSSMRHIFMALQ